MLREPPTLTHPPHVSPSSTSPPPRPLPVSCMPSRSSAARRRLRPYMRKPSPGPWARRADGRTEGCGPCQAAPGGHLRCPEQGSPSPVGTRAPGPVTHPCSAGALCWNERWGLRSQRLPPALLPPPSAPSESAQSPQLQPGPPARLLWAPASGWPREWRREVVPWLWPLHTLLQTGCRLARGVSADTDAQGLASRSTSLLSTLCGQSPAGSAYPRLESHVSVRFLSLGEPVAFPEIHLK